jgi:acetyl-CoA synthetase
MRCGRARRTIFRGAAIEEFGVTGIFTSPTAVRMLMRYGNEPLRAIDHSRLERIVCAGEVLNAPAWDWLQNTILGGRVPVIDHMWQTDTSGPVFGEKGIMVLKRPFPGLTAGLWGEPERYGRDYWERIPGVYYSGDSAHVDEDGYVWFGGAPTRSSRLPATASAPSRSRARA